LELDGVGVRCGGGVYLGVEYEDEEELRLEYLSAAGS
jgi:hypothetical protein